MISGCSWGSGASSLLANCGATSTSSASGCTTTSQMPTAQSWPPLAPPVHVTLDADSMRAFVSNLVLLTFSSSSSNHHRASLLASFISQSSVRIFIVPTLSSTTPRFPLTPGSARSLSLTWVDLEARVVPEHGVLSNPRASGCTT
ncbi:hypothetical protein L226DRAFT_265855 [Lentinus tigrinus ALCF2SS1-7]|uniref:uncharacterized protein n=1 Tax=Lentinus tigrinus ALCF2SS1-7 TaxID=1328758 RepID=UPI0011662F7D|nr:hypothetical protein L226DRAFT_265855 [Lentinus tigrinus ALCF2SS1-7]